MQILNVAFLITGEINLSLLMLCVNYLERYKSPEEEERMAYRFVKMASAFTEPMCCDSYLGILENKLREEYSIDIDEAQYKRGFSVNDISGTHDSDIFNILLDKLQNREEFSKTKLGTLEEVSLYPSSDVKFELQDRSMQVEPLPIKLDEEIESILSEVAKEYKNNYTGADACNTMKKDVDPQLINYFLSKCDDKKKDVVQKSMEVSFDKLRWITSPWHSFAIKDPSVDCIKNVLLYSLLKTKVFDNVGMVVEQNCLIDPQAPIASKKFFSGAGYAKLLNDAIEKSYSTFSTSVV